MGNAEEYVYLEVLHAHTNIWSRGMDKEKVILVINNSRDEIIRKHRRKNQVRENK
jgi:hypothetical protein